MSEVDQPLISVIVPVYNVEAYLQQCVDSIRSQTYRNLEIILVDDGSPDRCGEMCDNYAAEDARIRVIHKENGGQAEARNIGLDAMHGEYVAFMDSDDWLVPDAIEKLYRNLIENDAQISCCGIAKYMDGKITSYYNDKLDQFLVLNKLEALSLLPENTRITSSLWDKLYKAEIFAGLRMKTGMIYEDMQILAYCLARAERVVYTAEPMYCYRLSPNSTLRGNFSPRHFDAYRASSDRVAFYREEYPQVLPYAEMGHIRNCVNLLYGSWGRSDWKEYRKILVEELKKPLPPEVKNLLSAKDRLKVFLVRIHPAVFYWVARLFARRR